MILHKIKKGIVFHGSGGLLYYYMGIAEYIQNNYDLTNVEFCGVSGGSIPAFILSTGLEVKRIWETCFLDWLSSMNKEEHFLFLSIFSEKSLKKLINNLKNILSENEKDDLFEKINHRLSIRMTRIAFFEMKQEYITNWTSIEDLLECIIASCWIPGIFGSLTRNYKGNEYIDGGFPNSIEDRGDEWIKIKVNTFQNIPEDIKVLLFASSLDTINSPEIAEKLYNQGYADAMSNSSHFIGLQNKHIHQAIC